MQGTWVSANVNLVNTGPTISLDRRGDLNINYTLIPSPSQNSYIKPIKQDIFPKIEPFIPKIPKLELNFPKMEPINIPKIESFKIPEIKPFNIPKIEPIIPPKMDLDYFKPKKNSSW